MYSLREVDVSFEQSNDYLMEVELCLNQSNELNRKFLLFLDATEKHYSNLNIRLDITRDINSFKVSCKGVVDSVDNTILNITFMVIKEFKAAFVDAINQAGQVDFSIYLWSKKAFNTPQIDFNLERVQLLGEIGANLSITVYTYDPD